MIESIETARKRMSWLHNTPEDERCSEQPPTVAYDPETGYMACVKCHHIFRPTHGDGNELIEAVRKYLVEAIANMVAVDDDTMIDGAVARSRNKLADAIRSADWLKDGGKP